VILAVLRLVKIVRDHAAPELTARVVKVSDISVVEVDSLSSQAGMFFQRSRLEWAWEDARWDDWLVAVRQSGRLVGLLPLSAPRLARWPDQLYDIGALTDDWRYQPGSTCVLGGRTDVRASILLDGTLSRHARELAAVRAVAAALDFARARGLHCAAAYVAADEEEFSAGLAEAGLKARPAPQRSVIRWPEPTITSYLAHLPASHREIVRRDWRKRDALGVNSSTVGWIDAIAPAAPLISAVLEKHGFQTHPKLVAIRLRRWLAILGHRAFALKTEDAGGSTGYVFGWHDRGCTIVYELGFQRISKALDPLTYLELLVYGPLAAACGQGASVLDLGLYANEPKRLRGAIGQSVYHWALLRTFRRYVQCELRLRKTLWRRSLSCAANYSRLKTSRQAIISSCSAELL
jgi:hypothetical protein